MSEQKRNDGATSSKHGILTQIKKMRGKDWGGLALIGLSFIPGKAWKAFGKKIWVVTEYENTARDNGYWFFKYLREKHPEIKAYYPISKESPDYEQLKNLGNIVQFGSFKHYCLFWASTYFIGTTKCYGFPYRRICEDLVQWNMHRFKYVFLNHGFTRGYSAIVDGNETKYDLLITCGIKDSDIIINENNQSEEIVKCLGFARHDSLNNSAEDNKQILIMPTWRNWLDARKIENNGNDNADKRFLESEYYETFSSLINNNKLLEFLEREQLKLVFYLHEYLQPYMRYFKSRSDRVIIGKNTEFKIQDLLKQSALLVTDYSSVCYDFSYMYKPVLYYQFDKQEFEKKHYASGESFSYEKDGFGEILFDESALVNAIIDSYKNGFSMEKKYKDRVDEFFRYHDNMNCQRIYDAINKL